MCPTASIRLFSSDLDRIYFTQSMISLFFCHFSEFLVQKFKKMNFRGVPQWIGLEFGFAWSPQNHLFKKNIRHIQTNQILRSMRRRFQFVNRCLRCVFPEQQLFQTVCEPPHVHEEHVYRDLILSCKIFDNQDTRTGIPDSRGNSKHVTRDFVSLCKIFDNLDTRT